MPLHLWEAICAIPGWIWAYLIGVLIGIGLSVFVFYYLKATKWHLPQAQVVIQGQYYHLGYDGRTREPAWVLEALFPGNIPEMPISKMTFPSDPNIPNLIQSQENDYKNSGYEISTLLLAPNGLGISQTEYPVSTTSPQPSRFNQTYRKKFVDYLRELKQKADLATVVTITGPLYLPHTEKDGKKYVSYQVIGDNDVAVPTHFFKVIFYTVKKDWKQTSSGPEFYAILNDNTKIVGEAYTIRKK